jgi:hypothetical protein
MGLLNPRVIYSLMFYVLIMTLLMVSKPDIMFMKDGTIKPFGVGTQKTVFSFGVFTIVVAIASFYTFTLIDIIFG